MLINKVNPTLKRVALAAFVLLALVQQSPAQAIVYDSGVAGRLQDQRNLLISKESDLLRDYDDLNRQVSDLSRKNDNPRLIDELTRKMTNKYSDLTQIRYDIKQVELKFL